MISFVITLPRLHERRATFFAGWNAPFQCIEFPGTDGERVQPPMGWIHSRGSYGLNASYVHLLSRVLYNGVNEPFAIFEDDAIFLLGWWKEVEQALKEVPEDWYTINLGADLSDPEHFRGFTVPEIISPRLAILKHAWRTHAVVYNHKKIADILHLAASGLVPIDQIYCSHMIQGWRCFLTTRRILVGARAGRSSCTGMEWKLDYPDKSPLGGPLHPALA